MSKDTLKEHMSFMHNFFKENYHELFSDYNKFIRYLIIPYCYISFMWMAVKGYYKV